MTPDEARKKAEQLVLAHFSMDRPCKRKCHPYAECVWCDNDLGEFVNKLTHLLAASKPAIITDPAARDRVLTCAFCGLAYPEGTPTHKHEALAAHIRECPEHPIGKELKELRRIAAHVPGRVWIEAKEAAGLGTVVSTLEAARGAGGKG